MNLETSWPETGIAEFNPPPAEQPAARLRYFDKRPCVSTFKLTKIHL